MRLLNPKTNLPKAATALLMILLCGPAYADQAADVHKVVGTPGVSLLAIMEALGLNGIIQAVNAHSASTTNGTAETSDTVAKSSQGGIDQTDKTKFHRVITVVDAEHQGVSSSGSTSIGGNGMSSGEYAELETEAHQADEEVFAAANNYADALMAAMMDHYANMTREQAIAEYVAEGREYGFFPAKPVTASNTVGSFFMSQAHAQASSTPIDMTFAAGNCKWNVSNANVNGAAGQICSGGNQSQQDYNKANGCGCAFKAAGKMIKAAHYEYGQPGADSDQALAEWSQDATKAAQEAKPTLQALAWYGLPDNGGGSSQLDLPSFFISKAYALPMGSQVQSAKGTLYSKAQAACQKHQALGEMKGTHCDDKNVESPISFANATDTSCARDPNYLATRATAGVDNKYDTQKCIDQGAKKHSSAFEPTLPDGEP